MKRQDSLLEGSRVLVVEDSFLFAEIIRENLEDLGCDVVGPVTRLARALQLAEEEDLDLAVLDLNLAGEYSFPIADLLAARGIPFVFLTGYDTSAVVPARFRAAPALKKPFSYQALKDALIAQIAGGSTSEERGAAFAP